MQILLTLKNSMVEHADVFSDAMDPELAAEVQRRLTGLRFGSQSLHDGLISSEKEQIRDIARFLLEQGL